jgi:hypothetical protein
MVIKPTIIETIRLNKLHWFGHEQRMEENRIPPKKYYMWIWKQQGWEVDQEIDGREDGRLVDETGWKERVYNRKEWKKLLRTARNCHILHMSMEWNEWN